MDIHRWNDAASGLRAILCVDDPDAEHWAGGIRTRQYANDTEAEADGRALAEAMTTKCALAGVRAGGAKTVVMLHPALDRPAGFRALGGFIEAMNGRYLAAGDLGTTPEDLARVAESTHHVRTDEDFLGQCVARSAADALAELALFEGREINQLTIGIQGCGAIGAAVARRLSGADLRVSDLNGERARKLADETGACVVAPDALLGSTMDVFCPCAAGGVLGVAEVQRLAASGMWGICGAANNIVRDADAANAIVALGLRHVPDVIASAGAVLQGVAESLMGIDDTDAMFEALRQTGREILERSLATRRPADDIAREIAQERRSM